MANIVKWALRPDQLRAKVNRREVEIRGPSYFATVSNELLYNEFYSTGPVSEFRASLTDRPIPSVDASSEHVKLTKESKSARSTWTDACLCPFSSWI